MKNYCVYILPNQDTTTLYIGVTNNLQRRMAEHKAGIVEGFTKKYNCTRLVYVEDTPDVMAALAREKQLKKWNREWKNKLIETINPNWQDLSCDLL